MYRMPSVRRDISLFQSSCFVGYIYLSTMEELLKRQKKSAQTAAERIGWSSVVLYAVLDYAPQSLSILSADFMMLVLKYEDYKELVDRLADGKRFFFIRGRKEYEYE